MVHEAVSITIPAQLKHLAIVDEPLDHIFDSWTMTCVTEGTKYDIKLAIQELCTNIVRHSYDGQEGKIRLQIELHEEPPSVVITTLDTGAIVFDKAAWQPPNLDEPQVHGLGFFLIQELMDEVTYQPSPGHNRWCLVKHLDTGEPCPD